MDLQMAASSPSNPKSRIQNLKSPIVPAPSTIQSPVIDAEAAPPSGQLCPACGTPVESLDKFCPACGTANPDYRPPGDSARQVSGPQSKYFKCQQCGAEVATD